MDLVRSCYEANFRFFQGAADLTRVKWFFAPKGAEIYPGVHSFGSKNWQFDKLATWSGIGEQFPQGMTYYKGGNPWQYVGLDALGDAVEFLNGLPGVPADYTDHTDDTGKCAECFGLTAGAYDPDQYSRAYDRLRAL